ncbi:Predicted phosphatase [hydrothermal vent metagenome]|uniref:Predicted phosphatase n=1 Tax=hydrothermal vent metagenome TaxID=652676 RepID=A0A1W1EIM6_9ZZZZ
MDGTLIDSSITIANAINFVREKLGLEPMSSEEILKDVNNHTLNPAKHFYNIEEFEPIHEEWFNQYYSENHHKELILYDGIIDMLRDIKANNKKLAIATNAYRVSTISSLKFLGILELFDIIVSQDEVENGKPSPDMLFKILDELDISNDDAIFIGDGSRDLLASRSANIDYLMVNWGFSADDKSAIVSVEELRDRL